MGFPRQKRGKAEESDEDEEEEAEACVRMTLEPRYEYVVTSGMKKV